MEEQGVEERRCVVDEAYEMRRVEVVEVDEEVEARMEVCWRWRLGGGGAVLGDVAARGR